MPLDFAALTRDPSHEEDRLLLPALGTVPALPALVEPTAMPKVPEALIHSGVCRDGHEHLVPVTAGPHHVLDLAAYHSAGLPKAPAVSLARVMVVERLHRAAAALPEGFGLAVFDAWRPLGLQQLLFDAAYSDPDLPPGFVTSPSTDPATPPPHLTGGTLDLTLTWRNQPLSLGTDFDDFTPAAHADAFETTPGVIRDLRRLLYNAMRTVGFVVIDCEWWHFEYGTRRWAAITGRMPLYAAAA